MRYFDAFRRQNNVAARVVLKFVSSSVNSNAAYRVDESAYWSWIQSKATKPS